MALREKLAERAAPYLEPGEQVRQVVEDVAAAAADAELGAEPSPG